MACVFVFWFFFLGICGKTRIAEVGGVPYLLPLVNQKKVSTFTLHVHMKIVEVGLITLFIIRRPVDQLARKC